MVRRFESLPREEAVREKLRMDSREMRETVNEVRGKLLDAGFVEFTNRAEAYRYLRGEYIVRRENVDKLMEIIEHDTSFRIEFDQRVPGAQNGGKYFNAALFTAQDERGLTAAFTEGFSAKNGVSLVEGFRKNETTELAELKDNPAYFQVHEDQGEILDRNQNRAVQGEVRARDIEFIVMRTPLHGMPREMLTETEEERLEEFEDAFIASGGVYTEVKMKDAARIYVRRHLTQVESQYKKAA